MPTFGPATLAKFADASASIPLRQLDRAFVAAGIEPTDDPHGPDGPGGARRIQFRRYVANVDQADPAHRDRLGDALGALIGKVATSKIAFLLEAAERDGFVFADKTFRPATTGAGSFAVRHIEDRSAIDECAKRLNILCDSDPVRAAVGATELLESVSRSVLDELRVPAAEEAIGLPSLVKAVLAALELAENASHESRRDAAPNNLGTHLGSIVSDIADSQRIARVDIRSKDARLSVGASVAVARFIAESFALRIGLDGKRPSVEDRTPNLTHRALPGRSEGE